LPHPRAGATVADESMNAAAKVALISGARGGLGAAIARALAKDGVTTVVGVRNPGDGRAVVAEMTAGGGQAREMVVDVTDFAAAERAAAECERVFGGLDILVNNAGAIHPIGAAAETAPEAFEACLRVNVTGAFSLARAVWPLLKQSGGRIVNILSGASRQPLAGWSAYCASKSALLMLTRSLDLEGEPEGIRCFGFAPGLVDTKMQRAIRQSGVNEISRLSRSALTHPDIPAQAVAWLASGDADDLAGQYVDVRDPSLRERAGLEAQ